MRAVAAGVAEPRLMKIAGFAGTALALHKGILAGVTGSTERRSEEFKVLRKCLAYSISVVAAADAKEGFLFLRELADTADPDLLWICKQNLKKNRLRAKFPRDVAILEKIVARAA